MIAAAPVPRVDEAHVMDIGPGQPVWGGDQGALKAGHGRALASAIQTGPVALGAAIAVIAVDGRLGAMPVGLSREVRAQASPLLRNRLGVLLMGGRHPAIQGHCQGRPPAGVMAQDRGLWGEPSPSADGTDRRHPTVVHRRSVRSLCTVSARVFSGIPPASSTACTQQEPLTMGLAPQPRTAMRVPLLLEPGSLYVMRDVARYQWKHGIMACKST